MCYNNKTFFYIIAIVKMKISLIVKNNVITLIILMVLKTLFILLYANYNYIFVLSVLLWHITQTFLCDIQLPPTFRFLSPTQTYSYIIMLYSEETLW